MSAIIIDIIDGSTVRETKDGYEATRIAKVSGLTGSPHSRQYAALTMPQMPNRGDAHPSIPGIVLDTRSVSAISKATEVVEVTLTYRTLDASEIVDSGTPQIEVGTALVSETTSRDVSGRIITITTTVPVLDDDGNQSGVTTETQVVTVTKQTPMMTLRYNRRESRDPADKSIAYTGTVGGWGGYLQSEPRWMCVGINGSTDDGGASWDVSYEFQYNPKGWLVFIEAIDPATGQPYLTGGGKLVRLYQEATYDLLNLPPPYGLSPQVFS